MRQILRQDFKSNLYNHFCVCSWFSEQINTLPVYKKIRINDFFKLYIHVSLSRHVGLEDHVSLNICNLQFASEPLLIFGCMILTMFLYMECLRTMWLSPEELKNGYLAIKDVGWWLMMRHFFKNKKVGPPHDNHHMTDLLNSSFLSSTCFFSHRRM